MEEVKSFENHTFVICAYKESKYLEECIKSLINQSMKSSILISTSTPNDYIIELARKYGLDISINEEQKGIGPDWNFAVMQSKTKYVTIAHQDDLYDKYYTQEIYNAVNKNKDIIMMFTNYKEIRNEKIVKKNVNLIIKSMMILPIRLMNNLKLTKKIILSFGNPICCPSVCLNIEKVGKNPFKEDMKSNIDWGTWLEFSNKKGAFVYLPKVLTFHRIHNESETSKCIKDNKRYQEDYEMFCRIWPKWFAKFIMFFYKNAERANKF